MAPKAENRFSALSTLRAKRAEEGSIHQDDLETIETSSPNQQSLEPPDTKTKVTVTEQGRLPPSGMSTPERKGPGRPKGRRSDPSYTQVSAYIPLELLLNVQDALAQGQRQSRQRTARPVSDLVEELLGNWLSDQNLTH